MRRFALTCLLLIALPVACRCSENTSRLEPHDAGIIVPPAPDATVQEDSGIIEATDADVCVVTCAHTWTSLDDVPNLFRDYASGAAAFDEVTQQIVAVGAYDNRVFTFDLTNNEWQELVTHGEAPSPPFRKLYLAEGRAIAISDWSAIGSLDLASGEWRAIQSELGSFATAFDREGRRLFLLEFRDRFDIRIIPIDTPDEVETLDAPSPTSVLTSVFYDRNRNALLAPEGRDLLKYDLDENTWSRFAGAWPYDDRFLRMATIRERDGALVVYGHEGTEWFVDEASTTGTVTWTRRPAAPRDPHIFEVGYAYAGSRDEVFQINSRSVQSFVPGGPWISRATIDYPPDTFISSNTPPLAYDPRRDEVYFVQDSTYTPDQPNEIWVRTTAVGTRWSKLDVPGPSPAPRFLHQTLWDSAHDRLILYGGRPWFTGDDYNDTWALARTPTPAWTEVSTSTRPPATAFSTILVHDTQRDRGLLFLEETGALYALELSDTPAWSRLVTIGTPPSRPVDLVYDEAGDRLIALSEDALLALELSVDPLEWKPLDAGPLPIDGSPQAVYLPDTKEMMIAGLGDLEGWKCSTTDELWFLDLDPAHEPRWRHDGSTGVRPWLWDQSFINTASGPIFAGQSTFRFDRATNCPSP